MFKCRYNCGITRQSLQAEEIVKYSSFAWMGILFGISYKPLSVDFKCKKCGEVFDSMTPEELKTFR